MTAAALATHRVVLVLRHWDAGPGGFANIQRCAIPAEGLHRRPLGYHGNLWWRIVREAVGGVHHLSTNDGKHGLYTFDVLVWDGEVIVRERYQICELADGDCSLLAILIRKPTTALRV